MKDYDPDDPKQIEFDRTARGEPPDGGGSGCAVVVGFVVVTFLLVLGTCAL
jgi:hypothetical protein